MKAITIDLQSHKSIKTSEKRKAKLENDGYELIHSFGDSRFFTLVYEKQTQTRSN